MFLPLLNGLDADFLLVSTAERMRRIGVGLPSSEASDGGAAREPLSEGVAAAGEKSSETNADSLSVADATLRKSARGQYSDHTGCLEANIGTLSRELPQGWRPQRHRRRHWR